MKKNTRKTFYLMSFFAIAAMVAMSFLVLPNFNSSGTVSAQKADVNTEVATADMIAIATNIRSANNFTVFADKAISDAGNSRIKGNVGVAGKGGTIDLSRASVEGNTTVDPSEADRAKSDLAYTFYGISQLPCTELADSELGGKSFSPGVYCVSSARIAGQVVLDAKNDAGGVFIFRVSGSLNTKAGSSIELVNQASPGNVYFVASDAVNVGKGSSIKGSIFAENDVKVDDGSAITGRILSLKGGVSLSNDSVQLVDSFIQICKAVNPDSDGNTDLVGRIFQFSVSALPGQTIEVQANQCSSEILIPGGGNVVITEANTSRLPGSSTLRPGRFALIDVRQINRAQGAPSAITGINLPARTANVATVMGGVGQVVAVQFVNQFAVVGFIEICKQGLDSDVTGFFSFVVDDVPFQGLGTNNPPQNSTVFTVLAGQGPGSCAGPIAVTVPSTGGGSPLSGTAVVTELKRVGFLFVGGTTDPSTSFVAQSIINSNTIAGRIAGTIFEAGLSNNQTRFNFFNRSNPALVKVCKVAGPGITEGTLFNFTVSGFAPVIAGDGTFTQTAVSRTFDVAAGLAANGGGCRFVPDASLSLFSQQRFVVGTAVTVTENGPTRNANNEEIRVSRITSSSGFNTVGTSAPACTQGALTAANGGGNVFFPPNGVCRTVVVPVRASEVVIQFTNFVFLPGSLKVCKVAGAGVAIGTMFTFTVTVDSLQGVFPGPAGSPTGAPNTITRTVMVAANSPTSPGCQVVNGPFTPGFGGLGTFNVGSVVTVTETATPGTTVTGIRSTSGSLNGTPNLAGRTAMITILPGTLNNGNFAVGTTEIEFTNSSTVPDVEPRTSTAYDFDGDKKADISVFRDGNWYLNRTKDGFTAAQFGSTGDKLVPADYDGDGKTDIAVFRADPNKGYFYILGSRTNAFSFVQFGINTDVPVVGDYDKDGKADIAVYRDGKNAGDPSYIYYRPSSQPGTDFVTIQLGAKGDIPVVGDYDADGKTDAAVYRPSNGTWYILRSTAGFTGVQFGISTDIPVAADYDGDGKTDIAVYRGGDWYLLQSRDGFKGLQFGAATDMPVPADVDGDGKDDIVVFRAGTWYWLNSKDGSFHGMNFGLASDIPVFCPSSHQ